MKSIWVIVWGLLIVSSQAQAESLEPQDLYGTWVRVGDGCRDLSEEELIKLARNGGGNSARRRMTILFDEDTFSTNFLPSLRCDPNFEQKDAVDFGNETIGPICTSLRRDGALTYAGNMVQLIADNCIEDVGNPWGCHNKMWEVKRVGDGLRMNALGDRDSCPVGSMFYIYFIPIPIS